MNAWGFKNVYVIDGGLNACKDIKLVTEPGNLTLEIFEDFVVDETELILDESKLIFYDEI